ncbi:MAG: hypothetical protein Q4D99_01830 [Bacillota bacterium]|nr:hypothetical protein [Bacillota bacterium]
MKIPEIISQCSQKGEKVFWAEVDGQEAIAYHKSLIYFMEQGTAAEIAKNTKGEIEKNEKLVKYFDVIEEVEGVHGKAEAFLSSREKTPGGLDAFELETMDGQVRWIDKKLLENFQITRKYYLDAKGKWPDMVFIEEDDKLVGLVMALKRELYADEEGGKKK